MRRLTVALSAVALALGLGACTTETPDATKREDASRSKTYESLVTSQPAASMAYSPTRATKNFWVETWDEPGKLSYVYLMNSGGEVFGYYILEGLPVSYCTSLIPPYKLHDVGGDSMGPNLVVPGPSVDGTYSSSSNCLTYYGKDATSGAYMEYTAGMGINPLIYDQPMPQYGAAEPMGDATLGSVK